MNIRKLIISNLIILIITISSIYAQKKELVYLKNGSIIEGKIIDSTENKIKIRTKCNCTWVYDFDDIEKITSHKNYIYDNSGFANFSTLNFMFGRNDYSVLLSPGITTINGSYFLEKYYAGFGVGIENFDYGSIPVFADFRYFFSNRKISYYLDAQAGYAFPVKFDTWDGKRYGGINLSGEIGIRNSISENFAINYAIGFRYQQHKSDKTNYYWSSYVDYNSKIIRVYNRIFFKIGFVFG